MSECGRNIQGRRGPRHLFGWHSIMGASRPGEMEAHQTTSQTPPPSLATSLLARLRAIETTLILSYCDLTRASPGDPAHRARRAIHAHGARPRGRVSGAGRGGARAPATRKVPVMAARITVPMVLTITGDTAEPVAVAILPWREPPAPAPEAD
jgi:hypothetical protein